MVRRARPIRPIHQRAAIPICIVYDSDANVLYELGSAARPNEASYPYGGSKALGVWGAWQVSYWDLNTNAFRTIEATSADAAGLPIMLGLVRPDEVLPVAEGGQGVITHAIRMTLDETRNSSSSRPRTKRAI